jgi:hypothetical protein
MEDGSRQSGMEEVLDAVRGAVFPEGALCTSWIVVTEWVDLDGTFWTYVAKDDTNPPWRHEGLLQYVVNEGIERGNDDEDDDD